MLVALAEPEVLVAVLTAVDDILLFVVVEFGGKSV